MHPNNKLASIFQHVDSRFFPSLLMYIHVYPTLVGVNNGKFNSKTKGWQKVKRTNAKVVKKRVGAADKHKQHKAAVSGARTGKHKRKAEKEARRKIAEAKVVKEVEMSDVKGARKHLNRNNNNESIAPMQQ